jgi:fido (protein-threonine AMPylation protein)
VLRNRVGVATSKALRDAENDLVEARIIELRESAIILGDRSYDLVFLQAIHRQLFQDVYDWAGDVRTVGLEKGQESFCPASASTGSKPTRPNCTPPAMRHVFDRILNDEPAYDF